MELRVEYNKSIALFMGYTYYPHNSIEIENSFDAGCNNDNKTAVKVEVEGLEEPVYFYKYDGKYSIVTGVNCRSVERKIRWNIEY